jgi:multidrug resistance efflux pump
MQTVGIKARPIDLDTSEKIQASQTKAMIRELELEIRKLNRLESKGAITGEAAEREKEKLREKRSNLRQGLTVEGEEKD